MEHANLNLQSAPNSAPYGISAIGDAVHDGFQMAMASAANLSSEPAAYLSSLAQDIAEAGTRFVACRTPLDVLALQQSYAMARGKAWLDSMYRSFERCVVDQGGLQLEADRLVLPE
jgi:hypothetical protein